MFQVVNDESHSWYDVAKDIIIPSVGVLLTTLGVFIAVRTLRENLRIAQANFELQMAISHRDTWRVITDLKLTNICNELADPSLLTEEEETHINFVIINVKNSFIARRKGILPRGIKERIFMQDVGEFFSFPLTAFVWQKKKRFHDKDFIKFIAESILIFKGEPVPPKGIKRFFKSFLNTIIFSMEKALLLIRKINNRL